MLAVWFLYKKAYRLQQVNRSEKTDQLVGRESTIYFKHGDGKYTVQMKRDGAIREIDVVSESGKTLSNRRQDHHYGLQRWHIIYSIVETFKEIIYDTRNDDYGCYIGSSHFAYFLSVFFLVTVSVKVTKYSLYMVRPAMIRSRRNCIMVALLLFGLLYRAMNSCL